MSKKVAVIGLGRFGLSTAQEVMDLGGEVLVIDRDPSAMARYESRFSVGVVMDARDRKALASQGLEEMDAVVMAIGEDFESSILVTQLLKELGCSQIIARGKTETHGKILRKVGAHEVVFPEDLTGRRVARKIHHPGLVGYADLVGGYALASIPAPEEAVGRCPLDGDFPGRPRTSVLLVRKMDRSGGKSLKIPAAETVVETGDILIMMGLPEDLEKWSGKWRA
jgi:trk system potassium uptake protein TrkA